MDWLDRKIGNWKPWICKCANVLNYMFYHEMGPGVLQLQHPKPLGMFRVGSQQDAESIELGAL